MTDTIPLTVDAAGVLRVGNTRVTLDVIVRAFDRGATAEEIVQEYSSLRLGDVYQVIGYYLNHGEELREYLDRRTQAENSLLAANRESWSPLGLRARLLARRNAS